VVGDAAGFDSDLRVGRVMKHLLSAASFVGCCAVTVGLYGLAGVWWALVCTGVLLLAWALLSSMGES